MSNATTINFSLAESGAVETRNAGQFQYVYIRSASAPFQLSLDGVNFFEAKQNDKYQTTNAAGKHITAKSISGAVIKVVLIHSVSPIVTQDTAVQASAAPTIVVGNFGRVANSPVDGLSPAIDVYNYCVIPNNGLVYLPNLLGTVIHDRQLLILSVRAGGAALLVLTGAQCGFMAVAAGQTVSIPTTDTFFISGVGGTAYVVIGEVYLYTP